ncbi:MBL fold metallo-hydrolase [Patescibacteria group bacterium]|nr:MBL fold metallo-hydrolase [Patescibacteria group bacterium]
MKISSPYRLFLVFGAIITLLALHELALLPDGKLHVRFLDVGQGDSIFLITPSGKQVLVDGGPDMSTFEHLGKYMPFFDRSIDLLVLTHPHTDHLASLPEVTKRYSVGRILLAGTEATASRYLALLNEVKEQSIPVSIVDPANDIDLGDGAVLDIVWPTKSFRNDKNLNNSSVVMRVLFADQSILLTGDIEEEAEDALLETGADIRSLVLKAPHHGSQTSSSSGFLLAVNPIKTIISVGEENGFGHPHPETISRYFDLNIPMLETRDVGTVSLEF